jgi:hypothetical protein
MLAVCYLDAVPYRKHREVYPCIIEIICFFVKMNQIQFLNYCSTKPIIKSVLELKN